MSLRVRVSAAHRTFPPASFRKTEASAPRRDVIVEPRRHAARSETHQKNLVCRTSFSDCALDFRDRAVFSYASARPFLSFALAAALGRSAGVKPEDDRSVRGGAMARGDMPRSSAPSKQHRCCKRGTATRSGHYEPLSANAHQKMRWVPRRKGASRVPGQASTDSTPLAPGSAGRGAARAPFLAVLMPSR